MHAKQNQTFHYLGNREIISEAELMHSNKGNGKGYLEEKYEDFKR